MFAAHGSVDSAEFIQDVLTGRSKDSDSSRWPTKTSAAGGELPDVNAQQHGGRALTVNEAKPREDRHARGGGGVGGAEAVYGGGGGGRSTETAAGYGGGGGRDQRRSRRPLGRTRSDSIDAGLRTPILSLRFALHQVAPS